ncbi:TIGR03435 family protein [Terriglobus sp. TAA 43]|uniref:TIGR03435 family protein n=1 Tax=Terriglobus sp. TAA 43 TaxID=278961 RepID=UPI00068927F3|nr:TIGR03435 family protein [Terriglobus sp. TAA 43]
MRGPKFLLLAMLTMPLMAQVSAVTNGFEVSTVKPTPAVNDGRTHINYPAGGSFSASNVTLRGLLAWAYDMPEKRILNTPDWMSRERFDLQAKTDAATDAKMREMNGDDAHIEKRRLVQMLIADRFALKLHRETQTLSALDLVVDGPPRLQKSTSNGKRWDAGKTYFRGTGLTTDIIAEQLGQVAGRVVVNRTGLTDSYDIKLEWSPDDGSAPADSNAPSFFRAIQEQLGLKLIPAKEPLEVLVLDSVEQPSQN